MGLMLGSGIWLILLALFKLLPLPESLVANAWITPLAGALTGAVLGGWRRISLSRAARLIEARHRLDQRLSTALELTHTQPDLDSPWTRLVVADAAASLQGLDLVRLLPFHLPRTARWIPLLVAAVIGLGFVPEYRSARHRQQQAEATALRESGRRLAELVRQELQRPEPRSEGLTEALQDARQIGERLSQARLSKAESLGALANVTDRLKEEARQLEDRPGLDRLRQAARSPSGPSPAGGGNPALQRQLDKLQQSLGAPPDALDRLASQLEEARKLAAGMQGGAPDGAAQQALSQSLSQLAESASQMGLDSAALQRALDAAQGLDMDRVLKDLAAAGRDLDKLRQMARRMGEMQKLMEQAGKDLAEQLDRGQAQAAAETLERMMERLRASDLSQEDLRGLLAEVEKAVRPAGDYGKVAELLQQAAGGLQQGLKSEASGQLAAAAKELRDLARQAGEAQQLADALEALQSAQLAMASGRVWKPGQCQGGACTGCSLHPGGSARAGKGGRPGRGVGTWADENGWLFYPEISERWDNTGLVRPDQAPRGHTDRGEGTLSKNVLPTKLQGQFSPGAMPSITLKGVSIVGRSTAPYAQVVEAAQSDARSALDQEQVPRAYRGAVRGYFDDLSK